MKLVNIHIRFVILSILFFGLQTTQAQVWTLDQCIETAIVNNKKLEIGQNNIQIGKERHDQVKSNLMPKVKVETDYKYFINLPTQLMPMSVFGGPEGQYKDAQFGVPHNINANLQFALPLYNPQIRSNIENTKIGIELAELRYQKSIEEIQFEISNLYFNAQILLSQMKFVDDNLINSRTLLKNIKLLKEQLMAKATDVDKISLQILQLNAKREIIKSNYDQVLNAMKIIMGISLDQFIEVKSNIEYQQMNNYSNQSTLDIQTVKTKNRLLHGELNSITKAGLPSIFLYGSYGLTGYGYHESPNAFLDFYPLGFIGVKASYTLFDGNMTKKKKSLKHKEIINNNLQLSLLRDQNNLLIENAKLKIKISRQTVETTTSQIDFAQSIYDKTVIQQKQGMASVTDVLLADNTLRETQQNYLAAIVEYLKADLELKKQSGNINK